VRSWRRTAGMHRVSDPCPAADVAGTHDPLPPLDRAAERRLSLACGLALDGFRPAHVARCVERATRRVGAVDARELAARIAGDPELRRRFRRAVAVSTTKMFRDAEQFELLGSLLQELGPVDGGLRLWSVGASDGSELCTAALVLRDAGRLSDARLLGSDLLPENIVLAEERVAERLTPAERAGVAFEVRDASASGPSGSWHVVLCRNVLIHLSPGARDRVLDRIAGALRPGGILILGRSERIPRPSERGLRIAGPNAYRRADS
jgi:chemotaxis protein methyltransferase CheR